MLVRLALRVAAGVAVTLLALIPLASCGGGGHGPSFAGTLEVANDISGIATIVRIDIDEVGGPDSFTYDPLDILPGESFFVDLFPDDYDLTIFWDDTTFEFHTVSILDGFTTTLTVVNP